MGLTVSPGATNPYTTNKGGGRGGGTHHELDTPLETLWHPLL